METVISMVQAASLCMGSSTSLGLTTRISLGLAMARSPGRLTWPVWLPIHTRKFPLGQFRKNHWYVSFLMGNHIYPANTHLVQINSQYLLTNLGMSKSFGDIDFKNLQFPATLSVDYIRVYQDPDNINIGCDPRKPLFLLRNCQRSTC